jgi:hypothetical protein
MVAYQILRVETYLQRGSDTRIQGLNFYPDQKTLFAVRLRSYPIE